ncbi:MAG: SIR2 family protein [Myxococcota bacterium]
MNKPGLTEDKVDGVLATAAHGPGWALCIGAGTSLPAFPDWNRLVRRLFHRLVEDGAEQIAEALSALFSADALIQAASTHSESNPADFAQILTDELYRDFLEIFDDSERPLVVRALSAVRPGDLSPARWRRFLDLLHDHWDGRMSCLSIAPLVSETLGTVLSPAAILSFNAEPLLFAAVNAHQACGGHGEEGGVPQRVDRVVRGISNRSVGRIPYVFCHGLLPIPGNETTRPNAASIDKLVFSEAAYLQLAGNVYSWQATSFLEACASRRVVFVGLSLSDANMRRWLSWVHDSRMDELHQIGRADAISTQHLWLNLDPGDPQLRSWIEASVAHLGVRLVWLTSWDAIGPVLARMLNPRGA